MNNFILFIVTLFCWSPTWYVIKFQLGYVDPLVSVFYRFLIAGIVIFIYLIYKKKNLKFSLNEHLWFLLFGVCLYSLNYVFFYLSNTYLISAFPAIVFSTVVIMNILGEGFYFKKKPSLKTLIGATIGMIGIIIIFYDEIFNFSLANGGFNTSDYTGTNTVIIPNGQKSAVTTITLVDDTLDEGDEVLKLVISTIPSQYLLLNNNLKIRIVDNVKRNKESY